MKANTSHVDREMLRTEYSNVWKKDQRMIDYCVNQVATMAILPGGELIVVNKRRIDKDFCFGESGYDYDDAVKAAQHARTSTDYFKRKNMERYDSWIQGITDVMNGEANNRLVIYTNGEYIGQGPDCRLYKIGFEPMCDIIDACGGECRIDELPGRVIDARYTQYRIATQEELEIILGVYQEAAKAHERKVDAYLKRYGMSKVHAWTYWRDA